MPCLTLWDKISQNLAHLEANSHKIFKSHRIFRPSYSTFFEEVNINHILLSPRKYWLITQEAVAPSRHDWKIVDWDVKPQHKTFCCVYHKLLTFKYRGLTILGALQSDFCKHLTEFYQISLKNLPYLTDFSPQLMACMSGSYACLGWILDRLQLKLIQNCGLPGDTCSLWNKLHCTSKSK